MLKYDDCGLRNVWLKNGYRYEEIKGPGKCLEIDDINGLHHSIAHHLINYRKRLSGAEIRFLRVEMSMAQNDRPTAWVLTNKQFPCGNAANAARPWQGKMSKGVSLRIFNPELPLGFLLRI